MAPGSDCSEMRGCGSADLVSGRYFTIEVLILTIAVELSAGSHPFA